MGSIRLKFLQNYIDENSLAARYGVAGAGYQSSFYDSNKFVRVFVSNNGDFSQAVDGRTQTIFAGGGGSRADQYSIKVDYSDNTVGADLTGGSFGDILRSGSGNDALNGGAGNDVLEGGAGGDAFDGGDGNDTVSYEHSTVGVLVDLDNPFAGLNDAAGDTFSSIENIRGSDAIDQSAGQFSDFLFGNSVRNVIEGGKGRDFIDGGGGGDVASYQHSVEAVTVNLTTNVHTGGDAQGDALLNIRDLLGSANDDSLTGDGNGNTLLGGAGDDTLDGGAGTDRLIGGLGDDTFIVDNAGDLLYETASTGSGTDTVESSVTYKLRVNIENLTLTGTGDINGTGNDAANTLIGNDGDNTLDGRGGADTLIGGDGDDRYFIDNGSDRVTEAANGGSDTIISSVSYSLADAANVEKLVLVGAGAINATGTNGNDVLVGNAGDNVLSGGLGNDKLTGGAGEDTFIFDTTLSRTNADKITDFTHGVDQIGLSEAIFSALSGGTLSADAFKDVGASGATVDADDRILYDSGTGALSYDADGAGGTKAVAFALLANKPAINHSDFFVFA